MGIRTRSVTALGATLAAVIALAPATQAKPQQQAARSSAQAPTHLRVSGQATDALVDTARPTLSWTVEDSGRGEAQTAYEVRVTDLPADRDQPGVPVWDSAQVYSATSTGVAYRGPALQADHTYEWSVRTWNKEGRGSAWSSAQRFDVGLLGVADWTAAWLQIPDGALARRSFELPKGVVRARLYIGAQGLVVPHLNGAPVDPKRVLDSSITDYAKRVVYRTFDVTDQLHQGRNALAVTVGQAQHPGAPTFIAQLSVTYRDGTHATIATDGNWKTAAGPVTKDDFYYGESYDARKQIAGWDTAAFDDSAWTAVPVYAPVAKATSLALNQPVTALDETACCGWSRAALVDGIDMSTGQSEGYHSATASSAATTKWVQVDLGRSQDIAGITLFPARPTNDPAGDFPGAGFPVRYLVQVSDDPTFGTATTVVDRTGSDQPNPGTAPVPFTTSGTGRYVRVTATVLPCRDTSCTFRLAELGVYGPHPTQTFGLTHLEADTTPPTRIVDTVAPKKTTTPASGVTVYDFGQNYVGQVTLRASAPAGTTATITKGELLDSAGRVTTSNISFSSTDTGRQKDEYTFDGSGTQTWTPTLNYAGFRYAEITGLAAGTKISVVADVIHSDVATTGSFTTSDPLLNQIQGALVQTQLNDLQGMPLDCPTREKRGWLGDAGDTDAEALANLDMQSLYSKWLGDIRTSINPNGSVPSVSPDQGEGDRFYTDPAWGTAFPQIVWDSYTQYGDRTVLRQNYAQVKNWVDYLATISDANHIVVNAPGSWGDDWLATVSTPHVYFQTLFYLIDSRLLANIAAALGNTADAAKYRQLATDITTGFTNKYFDAAHDTYGTGTQLSYAMPLALGIVPAGHESAVVAKLVADIVSHNNHVTTGFVGTTYVYQALAKYHRNDIALAIAQRTDYPSFGYMLAKGPGTIWEKWVDSSAPDGTSSKDHIGLAGSIGQWYYQQLAGIQPGTAGFRTFTLAPSVVGNLSHVSAQQQTVRGTIASAWRVNGDTLTYHAQVPVGSTATIKLPLPGGAASTVREGGYTVFTGGHAADADPGLTVHKVANGALTMTAGSGDYTFTVRAPRTPVTQLAVTSTGSPAPITAGHGGDIPVLVEGHSTSGGSAQLSAVVPSGWTAQATPAKVALTSGETATLATVHVTVPSGATGGVHPVTVTARAPDGTVAGSTVDVLVFGGWPAGTTAAASSEHAPNVVNGATRTYVAANAIDGDLATFWNDDTAGQSPDTLTVTSPAATQLTGVGFASMSDGVPTAFTVQTWDGAQWVTQTEVTGNSAVYRWIPFPAAVMTTQVRLVVTATQDSFSRVAELTP
jgi:alpha-L-rhamnosidase